MRLTPAAEDELFSQHGMHQPQQKANDGCGKKVSVQNYHDKNPQPAAINIGESNSGTQKGDLGKAAAPSTDVIKP